MIITSTAAALLLLGDGACNLRGRSSRRPPPPPPVDALPFPAYAFTASLGRSTRTCAASESEQRTPISNTP